MAIRIAGIVLPQQKRIERALTAIYGIGVTRSRTILSDLGINFDTKVKDISPDDEQKLREVIEKKLVVEGDLKRERLMDIKRLIEINAYRGLRHKRHLPARGQRTKTNSRTVRGNVRRTMGSGRTKTGQKT
ncbi:MAG: 30S ribosomal protein S13 [Parcubacteria group bacterium CG08_land_8_20_14_0_20_48_21]|nr:MAG: 30S ribosomal protein S13 [Parcubacteria group bacterium CG2_30_48_51]PIS32768.1 MAG: 30S ribosomal protein S13 [Parcubacteria group bacterium CG08_land_8_20_14_0_20_48_21]PIW79141.1 MAG: 30S ribosomal protein S13 [Parcubacteria group bacterium CG_4_8_14_3_um_filter_48_16]PIY77789.1 MAG: 30S ribosomal protein S13 [Parcubacteria group bacterium CG_4_10_14_0_8_um_filter_48_154]PIZ77998.1 MAG: 30S ribosomal protein S13 [bacterium CG_4_10_14_0_2_um_filter_48_144]PJC39816.1 MAG: 30S ribosom